MNILRFTRGLLKIWGIPVLQNSNFGVNFLKILQMGLVLFCPVSIILSAIYFCSYHLDDVELVIAVISNLSGSVLASCMYISFCCQSDRIENLFKQMESLVDESEYSTECYSFN